MTARPSGAPDHGGFPVPAPGRSTPHPSGWHPTREGDTSAADFVLIDRSVIGSNGWPEVTR